MKYAVVTGVSQGFGAAIAEQMMQAGMHVIGVSRTDNERLTNEAKKNDVTYSHHACDLSSVSQVEETLATVTNDLQKQQASSVIVIQNAGVIEPIDRVGALDTEQLIRHTHINYIAPMIITNGFFKALTTIPVTVVYITSGAAEKTYEGWSVYGSTKAGLNHFNRITGVELEAENSIHKSIAFSPSVMDTNMQDMIRSSSKDSFAAVEDFRELKRNGQLRDPRIVAQGLTKLVCNQAYENGRVYHITEFLNERGEVE
ncbi:(S)-benzoin forming benzil reductase [Pontibacillus litoralis]|uniref:Short-chain dehydrogenase n=1 Tax=Pontibacillus litoralis JSM 072002 TaxID=1385512 RepID=A0A0A5G566_9BACI|nr:(S)-benzoin forming benzil reductase [Pontibacillus litoralis]KGX86230.1 short-chain dehydrogenase [Pontibacillus litoralis JSM 072002]